MMNLQWFSTTNIIFWKTFQAIRFISNLFHEWTWNFPCLIVLFCNDVPLWAGRQTQPDPVTSQKPKHVILALIVAKWPFKLLCISTKYSPANSSRLLWNSTRSIPQKYFLTLVTTHLSFLLKFIYCPLSSKLQLLNLTKSPKKDFPFTLFKEAPSLLNKSKGLD